MKCNASGLSAQRGIAAMEFALVLVLILALLFGVVAFGSILWVQQSLSFAAGEGARSILLRCENMAIDAQSPAPCPSPAILAQGCETARQATGRFSGSTTCATQLHPAACPDGYAPSTSLPAPQRLRLALIFDSHDWPPIHTAAQAAGMIGIDDLAPATLSARSTLVLTANGACQPS